MFMFCMYISVSVSLSSYRRTEKMIIGSLNGNFFQTLRLWFPFKGRVFLENFWNNEYVLVFGYPGGKHTPLYIYSM